MKKGKNEKGGTEKKQLKVELKSELAGAIKKHLVLSATIKALADTRHVIYKDILKMCKMKAPEKMTIKDVPAAVCAFRIFSALNDRDATVGSVVRVIAEAKIQVKQIKCTCFKKKGKKK